MANECEGSDSGNLGNHFSPAQILEYTPRDHSDRLHLTLALEEAEKLCQKVNEGVQQQENTERLEWMQSHIQLSLNEVSPVDAL